MRDVGAGRTPSGARGRTFTTGKGQPRVISSLQSQPPVIAQPDDDKVIERRRTEGQKIVSVSHPHPPLFRQFADPDCLVQSAERIERRLNVGRNRCRVIPESRLLQGQELAGLAIGFLGRILLAGEGIGVADRQGALPLVMLLTHPPQAFLAGVPDGRSTLDHGRKLV